MSRSLVKSLQEATGKQSIFEIIKAAGLNIILDGKWMETSAQLSGGAQTKLVGTDELGNKYYEDNTRMYAPALCSHIIVSWLVSVLNMGQTLPRCCFWHVPDVAAQGAPIPLA